MSNVCGPAWQGDCRRAGARGVSRAQGLPPGKRIPGAVLGVGLMGGCQGKLGGVKEFSSRKSLATVHLGCETKICGIK